MLSSPCFIVMPMLSVVQEKCNNRDNFICKNTCNNFKLKVIDALNGVREVKVSILLQLGQNVLEWVVTRVL